MHRRILITVIAALGLTGLCNPPSFAQAYPAKPLKIIVPFAPGGVTDMVSRVMAQGLTAELGQAVIVENRAGASGIVGTDTVAKSARDGYTLLVVASSHTVSPATNAKLPYDTERDFAPISLVVRDPLLFVVGNTVPANTLSEFIALAKSQPAKINYATPGPASQSHLVTELFSQRAGIKMLEVPYRGGGPAMLALIAGEVQFAVLSTQLSAPHLQSGRVRAIASGGRTRDPHFPNLPTLNESGFPEMEALQWVGILAPAGMPNDIVTRLNAALRRILVKPDIVSKLAAQGMTAATSSPDEFKAMISAEIREWKDVAQKAGISLQ